MTRAWALGGKTEGREGHPSPRAESTLLDGALGEGDNSQTSEAALSWCRDLLSHLTHEPSRRGGEVPGAPSLPRKTHNVSAQSKHTTQPPRGREA